MGKLCKHLGRLTMMRATASLQEALSKLETGCLRGLYTVSVCIGKRLLFDVQPLARSQGVFVQNTSCGIILNSKNPG